MHHLYEMLRPVGIITLARRLQYQIQRLRHVPYLEVFLESQGRGQGGRALVGPVAKRGTAATGCELASQGWQVGGMWACVASRLAVHEGDGGALHYEAINIQIAMLEIVEVHAALPEGHVHGTDDA